jgi:hypothetical protein
VELNDAWCNRLPHAGAALAGSRIYLLSMLGASLAMASLVWTQFAPGAMSHDTLAILEQARTGLISNGHPPAAVFLWGFLYRTFGTPAAILAFNLLLFYGGLFLLFSAAAKHAPKLVFGACLVVGLYPAHLGIAGALWIDLSFAGLLMVGIGLIATAGNLPAGAARALVRGAALLALIGGLALRHNGPPAVWPLLALWWLDPRYGVLIDRRRIFTSATVAAVAIILAFIAITKMSSLAVVTPKHLWRVGAVFDVAGVSVRERQYLFDDSLFPGRLLADLDFLYTPRSAEPLLTGRQVHALPPDPVLTTRQTFPVHEKTFDDRLNPVLARDWSQTILLHPVSWLNHRFAVFQSLVTRSPWGLWGPVYGLIPDNALGVPPRDQPDGRYFKWLQWIANATPLFVPVGYLVICAACALPAIREGLRHGSVEAFGAAALFASGVTHMLGLFPFAASADFRYSHWMIICAVSGGALLTIAFVARRGTDRRSGRPPQSVQPDRTGS